MINNIHGRRHLHKKKLEDFPGDMTSKRSPWGKMIEKLVYFAGAIGLLMTIPQIYKIYVEQSASGLSLISWISYFLINLIWINYGLIHKEKPIYMIGMIAALFYIAIIVGIAIYG